MEENVVVETPQVETPQPKSVNPKDVVRELSKTFSVNLFEEDGLSMLKEKLATQSTNETTLKSQVDELSKKEQLFAQKEQEYQIKISALGLGFSSEQLDEVLALAKVNTKEGQTINDGLKVVKEKYGSVFVTAPIGLQHNDLNKDKPDPIKSEKDKYMAQSPAVQKWNAMQKAKN